MTTRVVLLAAGVTALSGCAPQSAVLADGRHFGYVRSVDTSASPPTIAVDTAAFLTGDEADRAAVKAGTVTEGEEAPNDYFVRNEHSLVIEMPVADGVRVRRIQCAPECADDLPGTFEGFAAAFEAGGTPSLADEYRGAASQYWITVEGGEVVAIEEQYLP